MRPLDQLARSSLALRDTLEIVYSHLEISTNDSERRVIGPVLYN